MTVQKLFSRTLQQLGPGSCGVSIPKQLIEYHDIEAGDEVMIDNVEFEEGKITYSLNGS